MICAYLYDFDKIENLVYKIEVLGPNFVIFHVDDSTLGARFWSFWNPKDQGYPTNTPNIQIFYLAETP